MKQTRRRAQVKVKCDQCEGGDHPGMQEKLEGLVPHVDLYRFMGTLHPHAGCENIRAGSTYTEATTVLKETLRMASGYLCDSATCTRIVTHEDVDWIRVMLSADEHLRGALAKKNDTLGHVRALSSVDTDLRSARLRVPSGPLWPVILTMRRRLQDLTEAGKEQMRTKTWRDNYQRAALGRSAVGAGKTHLALRWLGVPDGDPEAPGMLVGTRPKEGTTTRLLTDALGYTSHDKVVVKAPVLVLLEILAEQADLRYKQSVGTRAQIIKMPDDMTSALEETTVGLFDPDGDGDLQQLLEAVEAARRIMVTQG